MRVERRALNELKFDDNNARRHDEKNIEAIVSSLDKFGQQKPIVVNKKGVVIAGNGTLDAAKQLGWESIAVVVTELDGQDASAYAIADNRTAELAEWDMTILTETLGTFDDETRKMLQMTDVDVEQLLEDADLKEPANPYTAKIESPVYEIKGECPETSELCDKTKTNTLCERIDKAKLPEDVAAFLKSAAERHTVFDYEAIAEFYAHAEPEVQDLMEQSALVIIDFEQAIHNGFVKMTKTMFETIGKDISDEV